MDSQNRGKEKSPVGKRGHNKGKGGQVRDGNAVKGNNQPRKGQRGRGRNPRGGGEPYRVGGTGNPSAEEGDRDRPRVPIRRQPTNTQPPTLTPAPPPVTTPLLMNKQDDRAPYKLFSTLKPLTGRTLSRPEWAQWCHGLERWTAGVSQWAYERSKENTPQRAWARRQGQKRGQRQGPGNGTDQEGEPNTEGRSQRGQGRNKTITRMANLQRSYNTSPKKCMDAIRHTPPALRCDVPIGVVSTFFTAKLLAPQGVDPNTPPPSQLWTRATPGDVMEPAITPDEVKRTLKAMDTRSAPGPDRIHYGTWKLLDPKQEVVTGILNTCRANGRIPPAWKTSVTILTHKGEDPLALDNWRPIALQNTLYKVYAAIIAKRVSNWAVDTGVMSPSQKGFLPMEGCLEHNHLLTSVFQDSRRRRRPVYLTWLDLKDAYGSVPHEILFKIMEMAGLRGTTLEVVRDFYTNTSTTVRNKTSTTDPISIKRGVKQGCPLSPILFNLVMEVFIRAAEEVPTAGYRLGNSVIKTLAYADDLCVLASTPEAMQDMMDKVHLASEWAGLTFSPRKCATLSIVRSQRARQRVSTQGFHLGPTAVPVMAWEDRYKYLGVKTGADHPPDLEKLGKEYTSDVEAIMKSELTDWQKMDAVHRFAKPRLVYALQNQLPPVGWARSLDKRVKAAVKTAMKLPRRTIDAFLYSPWRSGGLGLPRVEDEIHIYGVSAAYRLLTLSNDPTVVDVAQAMLEVTARKRAKGLSTPQVFLNNPPQKGEGQQGDIKSLWSRVRLSLQLCQATIDLAGKQISIAEKVFGPSKRHLICSAMRAALQRHHLSNWGRGTDQGRAAKCISAHEASNHWIRGGRYTSFAEYRFAIKARLNLLPTRTVRKRGGEAIQDTSCQRCHEEQETLAHVLNHCPPNVGLVRARHNRILHRLARAIPQSKGVQLLEQTVPGDRMTLKPDLVILNKDTSEAYVVDVTVPFEGEDSFRAARQGKVDKYHHLKQVLEEKGYRKVEVDGFIVGALGSWDPENEPVLRKLSIGRRYAVLFRKLCCTEAIKGSHDIWKAKTTAR